MDRIRSFCLHNRVAWLCLVIGGLVLGSWTTGLPRSAQAESPKASEQDVPEKFTVMTWNLEWFYDENTRDNYSELAREKSAPSRAQWDWRRDAVAGSIAKVKPSLLALQEVENRRVLWYLGRALDRSHQLKYEELADESNDLFTEQDVGFMYRSPVDVLQTSHFRLTSVMKKTQRYYDLTKHIVGVFEVPNGTEEPERVTVLNLHLRSRAEGESLRRRQARLVQHWIGDLIASGQNTIVLGDTNTEEKGDTTIAQSDLGILCGSETATTVDDLVDVTLRIPRQQRRTHLLPDRQFDRILVSQSLLDDDPTKPDLVFQSIEVLRDLSVQGELDTEAEHWERYWELDSDQRDLSDHLPVLATFEIK